MRKDQPRVSFLSRSACTIARKTRARPPPGLKTALVGEEGYAQGAGSGSSHAATPIPRRGSPGPRAIRRALRIQGSYLPLAHRTQTRTPSPPRLRRHRLTQRARAKAQGSRLGSTREMLRASTSKPLLGSRRAANPSDSRPHSRPRCWVLLIDSSRRSMDASIAPTAFTRLRRRSRSRGSGDPADGMNGSSSTRLPSWTTSAQSCRSSMSALGERASTMACCSLRSTSSSWPSCLMSSSWVGVNGFGCGFGWDGFKGTGPSPKQRLMETVHALTHRRSARSMSSIPARVVLAERALQPCAPEEYG